MYDRARDVKLIAYHRVSTAKQGQSGLGLDAQASAIGSYAERVRGQVLATFTEVESGKANDRPSWPRLSTSPGSPGRRW